tara:strand:- start:434 stop:1240 length:807 start_codon:yes stop_codon:yes gene_type:complete
MNDMGGLPGLELQAVMSVLAQFFLATIRVGAFLVAVPVFGAANVPLQVRIILSALLGVLIMGYVPVPTVDSFSELQILGVIVTELVVGLSAGLIITIWFTAAVLAGEKIATSAGLGFAAQIDPSTGASTPVVSKMLSLFLIVIFLGLNGHLVVIRTMLDSYSYMPIGEMPAFGALIKGGISAAGSMFLAATIIMMPIAITMLLINLAIGVITRSAPQLNLFSFGFPISMLAVFVVLYMSVGVISLALQDLVHSTIDNFQIVMRAMTYG